MIQRYLWKYLIFFFYLEDPPNLPYSYSNVFQVPYLHLMIFLFSDALALLERLKKMKIMKSLQVQKNYDLREFLSERS